MSAFLVAIALFVTATSWLQLITHHQGLRQGIYDRSFPFGTDLLESYNNHKSANVALIDRLRVNHAEEEPHPRLSPSGGRTDDHSSIKLGRISPSINLPLGHRNTIPYIFLTLVVIFTALRAI